MTVLMSAEQRGPGQPRSVVRLDADQKVHGEGIYASDVVRPGMLHARVVRSHVARGRVVSIDCTAAAQVPGVVGIVTREDLAVYGTPPVSPPLNQLFPEVVNFIGEAVAAVAAESSVAAQQAADLIEVEYEELPAVLTLEAALAPDAPQLSPANLLTAPLVKQVGDPEAGFAQADQVFERTYRTPRQSHATIEPVCCVAEVQDDQVVIRTVTDSPFKMRHEVAGLLGLPDEAIRIISTGGATYGNKNMQIASLEPVAALLALKTKRPVRLAFSSEEMFRATCTRHAATITLKTGVRRDGRIVAMEAKFVLNSGAYGLGERVVESMASKFFGTYPVEHMRCNGRSIRTNAIPGGAYRGVASVQMFFALETHVNEIAASLGIDPLAFRRLNHIRSGHRLSGGTVVDATPLERCLAVGAETFGWKPGQPPEQHDSKLIGRGMAIAMHHTGRGNIAREGSAARAELREDGRVCITTAIPEKGQGAQTALAQIAAEALKLPLSQIEMRMGDTFETPFDYLGAEVNRATYVAGLAIRRAGEALRAELEAIALEAQLCEQGIDDGDDLLALVAWWRRYQTGPLPRAEAEFRPEEPDPRPVFSAHFAEVEVDRDTGDVRVRRYLAVQDIGQAINPDLCQLQTEGGVYHAAGLALRERLEVEDGQPVNGNFMEYPVGAIGESFPVEVVLVETPGENPKGIGTSAAPAVAPAIAAAVAHAIGRFVRELPLTPERVLRAMEQ